MPSHFGLAPSDTNVKMRKNMLVGRADAPKVARSHPGATDHHIYFRFLFLWFFIYGAEFVHVGFCQKSWP
jgi:hypothetical protein